MIYEMEYNSRAIPASDVARFFVPPESHFKRLLSRNHSLLLGPRGSGKTTLLKMLTVRALSRWSHEKAEYFTKKISFNAAFIPADIAWGKQIGALGVSGDLGFRIRRQEAAFVLHTLRAFVHAIRQARDIRKEDAPSYVQHLSINLSEKAEQDFVKIIANGFQITPIINSLLGLEIGLEARLDSINSGHDDENFAVESLPSKISLLVSSINGLIGEDDRRWALLFDEMEIAPDRVKSFLLSSIRSFDERIVIKLALAPYMGNIGFDVTAISPHALHDYHTVQLSYPNKEEAVSFSEELFFSIFKRLGFNFEEIRDIFDDPSDTIGFGRRSSFSNKRRPLPLVFQSLARKDDSFSRYATAKKLFSAQYNFNENSSAQDIRKVLPIVILRDYYIRSFRDGRFVWNRSRKSSQLYTGFPSVIEITEGNPRAILTFVGPLIQECEQSDPVSGRLLPIPATLQARAIRRVELLLTSLLQVIPLDQEGLGTGKGLLEFVDQIGRAFEDKVLRQPFATDYVGTFLLDEKVSEFYVSAVGMALNAGAIIHVPYPDSGQDSLLRGLRGQRFRLSYALAPRYRLLLTLGDRINLSKLMAEPRGFNVDSLQSSLFDSEELK